MLGLMLDIQQNNKMRVTIDITEDEKKILKKRADKNYFSLKEQVEDIIRRSCVSQKSKSTVKPIKVDDRLVGIFSRERRGRKRKR